MEVNLRTGALIDDTVGTVDAGANVSTCGAVVADGTSVIDNGRCTDPVVALYITGWDGVGVR